MTTEIQTAIDPEALSQVLLGGDLAKLNATQKVQYYNRVCELVGLNPLTKPFDFITLNGKLVLYANKGCAEQLRMRHKISIKIVDKLTIENVYVVTAEASWPDGRTDSSTGGVDLTGLKGEKLANAFMKAETKAKRRVTLSICGLNMLDEVEVETIGQKIAPEQPSEDQGDGITTESVYKIPFGKWKGRTLEDCYKNFGPQEMGGYIDYIIAKSEKDKKPIEGVVADFIEIVEDFLGHKENDVP